MQVLVTQALVTQILVTQSLLMPSLPATPMASKTAQAERDLTMAPGATRLTRTAAVRPVIRLQAPMEPTAIQVMFRAATAERTMRMVLVGLVVRRVLGVLATVTMARLVQMMAQRVPVAMELAVRVPMVR